ncbi:MAG TPA: hypothetical protein VNH11_18885 [Pirellulales bacterium]|nr:hypothetical protein [Pirellulales bacterium]
MAAITDVGDNSRKVLRILHQLGATSGKRLKELTHLDSNALVAAASELRDLNVIAASESALDTQQVDDAYYNLMPSAVPAVQYLLSNPQQKRG